MNWLKKIILAEFVESCDSCGEDDCICDESNDNPVVNKWMD
jgi:hypothetical protein